MPRRRNRKTYDPSDAVHVEVGKELDLHHFQPSEVGSLVKEYLEIASSRGWPRVKIIHGKGTGTLRETVHHILKNHPLVIQFRIADALDGGWGATIVRIKRQIRDTREEYKNIPNHLADGLS